MNPDNSDSELQTDRESVKNGATVVTASDSDRDLGETLRHRSAAHQQSSSTDVSDLKVLSSLHSRFHVGDKLKLLKHGQHFEPETLNTEYASSSKELDSTKVSVTSRIKTLTAAPRELNVQLSFPQKARKIMSDCPGMITFRHQATNLTRSFPYTLPYQLMQLLDNGVLSEIVQWLPNVRIERTAYSLA